jgi:hypothetical protein
VDIFVVELFISDIICLQLLCNYCFDLFLVPEQKARKQKRPRLSRSAGCNCKLPVSDTLAACAPLTPENCAQPSDPGAVPRARGPPLPRAALSADLRWVSSASGVRVQARVAVPCVRPARSPGACEKRPPVLTFKTVANEMWVPCSCPSVQKLFRKKTEKGRRRAGGRVTRRSPPGALVSSPVPGRG